MSKRCKIHGGIVLYLDCLEGRDKRCKNGEIRNENRRDGDKRISRDENSKDKKKAEKS